METPLSVAQITRDFSGARFFWRTEPFTPLNNPGGPEGDTVTVAEKLLNTEYPGQDYALSELVRTRLSCTSTPTSIREKHRRGKSDSGSLIPWWS